MRNKAFEEILASATNESIERVREFMGRLEEGETKQRIEALEQRVQRQAELLEQMERALDELTGLLRPSPDPIQQLHKQIIDQYPVEPGQVYQAIDSDGAVCRYRREPRLNVDDNCWDDSSWLWIMDTVELNNINWKDTLIKLDPTDRIQQLHQQIIDEHPLEYGQRFQAIDRDGTAWRFSSEPYIGMSTSNWWNNGGAVWCITDDVQLNGINWRDTLIEL